MTIQEIQAAIDAKYDARQIINMIADYLEDNPNGGASGIDDVLAIGQALTADREIDFKGKKIELTDVGNGNADFAVEIDPIASYIEVTNGAFKSNQYMVVGQSDGTRAGIYKIYSPNGSLFQILVDDAGVLSVVPD